MPTVADEKRTSNSNLTKLAGFENATCATEIINTTHMYDLYIYVVGFYFLFLFYTYMFV